MDEFQNYEQVIFRPIIRTDKKYVECQYKNFTTWGETCFYALIITHVKVQKTISFSFSKSRL